MSASNPTVIINIAIDSQALFSQPPGPTDGTGIYMMDNWVASGSTGQGSSELYTQNVQAEEWVGWNVNAIDSLGQMGDSVEITSFEISDGINVWGTEGYWQAGSGNLQWIAQAKNAGKITYQVKVGVSTGNGAPVQYYTFDPFVSVVG